MRLDRQLALELLWRQLLEVAGIKAGRIVDQHVDAAEPVDSGANRRLGIGAARDVQLDGQQVIRLSQCLGHRVGVSARGHHRVTGRQCGLGEIGAHATASAGDEPNLLVDHHFPVLSDLLTETLYAVPERLHWRSELDHHLDGFTVIHRTIAIRDIVDIRSAIEHEARLYSALEVIWH